MLLSLKGAGAFLYTHIFFQEVIRVKKLLYSLLVIVMAASFAFALDIDDEEDTDPVRLGIMPFTSKAYGVPDGMAAVIGDFFGRMLYKSEGITLLERERLEDAGAELRLGMSGLVNNKTAAQIGKLAGCQYILLGSITNLAKGGSGMGLPGFGLPIGLGVSKEKVKATLDVRVIDVETGSIVFAEGADGEAERADKGVSVYGIDFAESEFGGIENVAITNAVAKLAPGIEEALTGKDTLSAQLNPKPKKAAKKSAKAASSSRAKTTRAKKKADEPLAAAAEQEEAPKAAASSVNASPSYENTSTDPVKVIKSYGLPSGEANTLRIKHINLAKLGNTKRAYKEYVKLAEENANDYFAAFRAGEISARLKNKDEAREWFEKALKVNPYYVPAQKALSKL